MNLKSLIEESVSRNLKNLADDIASMMIITEAANSNNFEKLKEVISAHNYITCETDRILFETYNRLCEEILKSFEDT